MAGDQSDRTPPAAASDITQAVRQGLVDEALGQIEDAAHNAQIEAEARPSADTLPAGKSGRPLLDAIGEVYQPYAASSQERAGKLRELAQAPHRDDFYTVLRTTMNEHDASTRRYYAELNAVIPPLSPRTTAEGARVGAAGGAPARERTAAGPHRGERPSDVLRNSPVKLRNPSPRRKPNASPSGVYRPVRTRPHHDRPPKPLT